MPIYRGWVDVPFRIILTFCLAGLFSQSRVAAQAITYTMTGSATGNFAGTPFVDQQFAIVVTGDTTARTGTGPAYTLNGTHATASITGFALADFTNSTSMFVNGLWTFNSGGSLFIGGGSSGWDLITPIGPLGFSLFSNNGTQFNNIPTSQGALTITSLSNGQMTASIGQCSNFTLPPRPFSTVNYVSVANSSGDRLVVGAMSSNTYLNSIPLPFATNQRFCAMQELATGFFADAYVPTVQERTGNFAPFAGLLLDPLTSAPFPFGFIPGSRLYGTWAWRIGATTLSLSFANLTQPGETTVTTSSTGAAPPTGFALGNPATYYDISTTAFFAGATVCVNYTGVTYSNEVNLRFFHYEGGVWVDRTSSLDTSIDRICANVASFSPFAVFEGAVPVGIDIHPGSNVNSINPKSKGRIPVAILSSSTFDAFSQVDQESLRFGRTGSESSLVLCNTAPEEVNSDAYPDLVCHFDTQNAGFTAGNTQGILQGKIKTGTPLVGVDSVRTVPK